MTGTGWESLAAQAPIVLIFAGAVFFLMREQAKNTKVMLDTFMQFMERRDEAIYQAMRHVAASLDAHDDRSRSHDQFMRERLTEREKA